MSRQITDKAFLGPYKEIFDGYCEYKKSLGFKILKAEFYSLKRINVYLNEKYSSSVCLKKEWVDGYICRYKGKSASTIHNQECILRGLGRYMIICGYEDIYIFPETSIIKNTSSFVPYIFTPDEIKRIFEAVDNVIENIHRETDILFFQVIYRLLYATGMRIGEAINLKTDDIDLNNDIITVYNGKGNVSRLIPFLPSLHYWLDKYKTERSLHHSHYFFHHTDGRKINQMQVRNNFLYKTLPAAGINPDRSNGYNIRVHDLRHTFACHSLDKAIKEGKDPFCVLPYLSVYMGHKDIKSTELYLRLTEDHFNEINEAGHYIYEGLGGEDE